MPRTSREEARELLLQAGVAEFRDVIQSRDSGAVLGGLSLEGIARRAGYRSVGMIYNLWQQEGVTARAAFSTDLLEEIARSYTSVEVELDVPLATDLVTSVRAVAMETVRYWSTEGSERHFAGRLLMSSIHIPPIRRAVQTTARETLDEFVAVLDAGLDLFGYQMKHPLRTVDMAVALRALLLGYLDMAEVHSEELVDFPETTFAWRSGSDWNVFAVASLGVVLEMIEQQPMEDEI